MSREIFGGDKLPHLFTPAQRGITRKQSDFDNLNEVGQWFFISETEMTKSQKKNNYRPQASCRLTAQGRKFKTIKGHYGPNEEMGIVVQRTQ